MHTQKTPMVTTSRVLLQSHAAMLSSVQMVLLTSRREKGNLQLNGRLFTI